MKKPRVLKSWSKRNVPLEIWPNILSRLPVRSVLRFRSVSKSWRALIDDPNFCRLHRDNFKNNRDETHLFIVERSVKEETKICIVCSYKNLRKTATLNSLDTAKLGANWDTICSVDGLVMIQYGGPRRLEPDLLDPGLVLWNPSIRKSRFLPNAPVIPKASFNVDLGFGFSPLTNDYKHVKLVLSGYSSLSSILIYTVGTGLWKTIEFQGEGVSDWHWDLHYDFRWRVVCCKGVLYFIASYTVLGDSRDKELVSFDLGREVFATISLPADDDVFPDEFASEDEEPIVESCRFASKVVTLVDGGCSLAMAYLLTTKGSVWVLETSGEWNKRYAFLACSQHIMQEDFMRPKFLYLTKNLDMMFEWWPRQVTSYNLESDEERYLVSTAQALDWREVSGYVESLVLLKG